ncbi:SusC/RagA family TonB-linked outer membrane protein [Dysgonomonas sp. 521]|uniref:SusC/RagA family TonB-linked outer membrane protein n=1 Tax=Dysgonomonas sp. 521 TaxID=2302932 RepID=UPI0013D8A109|nr:SusC/RagA family TonB-linked outer membrane protein [Dysgonomonas sp. 521]NDV94575.1 SusC/RagA family TonB-linked outer membrane protein [Dysgonomonas sp. 521]
MLKIRKLKLLLLLNVFVLLAFAQADDEVFVIKGRVTDASGSGLPGVTIQVKSNTQTGTLTDVDGYYSISVERSDYLVFSYLGFETHQVQILSNRQVDVVLKENSTELNEVVVTSLNIPREKKALGYAVQNVSGKALETRPTNALSALSGKISGLQVISGGGNMGGSSRVTLRGINSITGNNQPLYIIDGVPLDNTDMNTSSTINGSAGKDVGSTVQDINPDDIADITVLKGPSAAALYGTRAANGVILITTKKGDRNDDRIDIQLNIGLEFENVVRLPKRQKLYGGGYSTTFQKGTIDGKEYNVVDYAADESWGPKLDGTPVLNWYNLDPEYPGDYLNPQAWSYPKSDVKDFFRTGISNTNNIALSKNTARGSFRVSFTNKNVKGTVPNSSLTRNAVNISGSTKGDLISFFGNVNYINNKSTGRPWTGASNRNIMLEAYQWGQVQVDYSKLKEYKRADGTPRAWNRTSWENTPEAEKTKYIDNPYWSAYESYLKENRDRLYGNVGLVITPTKWLSLTGRINGDIYQYNSQDRIAYYSRSQSMYQEYSQKFDEFNYEFLATSNNRWGNHSLVANLGANYMRRNRRVSDIQTSGGLRIPEYYSLNNASSVIINPTTGIYKKAISSVYGSVSYGWKSMLYVDGTIRNDWSSTLPKDENSFLYPSVTGSFVFTELPALKNQNWLSFGKVRLGWAEVGNDTDPYQLYKTYEAQTAFDGNISYTLPDKLNNPELKPEITSSWEAGLQLQFLNNLIGLDVTYYDNNTRNQIISLPTSDAFGYSYKLINAGKINNKGVEATLTVNPIRQKDWDWTAIANFSKNSNKIIKLSDAVNTLQLSNTLVSLVAEEGESYGQIKGYDFVYASDGQKVVNSDGVYMRTDQFASLGSVLPDFLWSFQNQLRYKNFTFGFLIDSRIGGKFFSQTYKVGMYSGILESTAANNIREDGIVLDGVTGDVVFNADGTYTVSNTATNDKRVTAQAWAQNQYNGPTAYTVFDATFIKLRELTLGYTFKLPKWKIESVSVTAYARNLWNIYTKSKDIDPELTNSSGNVQGIEGGNIPVPVTYGLNLGFKF